MFSKKVPIAYLILAALITGVITYLTISRLSSSNLQNTDESPSASADQKNDASYNVKHSGQNYKYISPIVSVDPVKESNSLSPIKTEITSFVNQAKSSGQLISAAVYLRQLSRGEWFAINPDETYNPGSLLKVGVLITYLRMAESDSKLLDMEVVYNGQKGFVFPVEHYRSESVQEGHKYKISELLKYMIKYSDNRATLFLEDHMDTTIFKREFDDLGITEPKFNNPNYTLNVKEYSMLFNALYSAGYLRKQSSENALALLSESTFNNGLLKYLPRDVVASHKFGESGNGVIHELHESGIIYLDNSPYLLTIMTRGKDWDVLSETIGQISKKVYDRLALSSASQATAVK